MPLGASTEYCKFSIKISNASKVRGGKSEASAQLSYSTKTAENMPGIGQSGMR